MHFKHNTTFYYSNHAYNLNFWSLSFTEALIFKLNLITVFRHVE